MFTDDLAKKNPHLFTDAVSC